jgi:hypothetical protein
VTNVCDRRLAIDVARPAVEPRIACGCLARHALQPLDLGVECQERALERERGQSQPAGATPREPLLEERLPRSKSDQALSKRFARLGLGQKRQHVDPEIDLAARVSRIGEVVYALCPQANHARFRDPVDLAVGSLAGLDVRGDEPLLFEQRERVVDRRSLELGPEAEAAIVDELVDLVSVGVVLREQREDEKAGVGEQAGHRRPIA